MSDLTLEMKSPNKGSWTYITSILQKRVHLLPKVALLDAQPFCPSDDTPTSVRLRHFSSFDSKQSTHNTLEILWAQTQKTRDFLLDYYYYLFNTSCMIIQPFMSPYERCA